MTTMLEQGQKMLRGELTPPPIARLLGLVMKSIEPGHAVFEMEADERHRATAPQRQQSGSAFVRPDLDVDIFTGEKNEKRTSTQSDDCCLHAVGPCPRRQLFSRPIGTGVPRR